MPTETTSEAHFRELTGSGRAVADFYAQWCQACKKLAPAFDELSKKFPDVKFVKVDVDEHEGIAGDEEVDGLPYCTFYAGGKKIKGLGGMKLSAESLEATLNDLMKADASGSATPAAPKQQPSGTHISSKPFDANEVVFNDPKSGNELRFTIDGNAIKYSVNGEPRPPFKQVVSNGADGLLFKDIGKGCGVPSAKERQLLLRLALKAGIEVAGFPDSDYSLPEEKKEQRTDTSIDSVQFEDAGSGNKLRFLAERNAISYTVNGKERPAFRVIIFDGESRLRFDDIGKGCVLPADRRDEILKAFKSMAARVGATIKGF